MNGAKLGVLRHDTQLGTCLPSLLKQQAAAQPDEVAVSCGDASLTYRELERASSALAACLRDHGVDDGDRVGLHVEPSLDLMTGAWGILAAGAAYLPLSPEYPPERLRYMLEDSRTTVILTQEHLIAGLTELAPRGTRILTLADAEGFDAVSPSAPRSSNALAYVIYTSGSTGRPKGVMIEHRSVMSQMRWMHACGHLGKGITVLQKTPMSFDAAQWEILAPAVGGRVVMGAPGIYRDPRALIATINKHQVTTLQCVPTLLQALLDTEEFHTCRSLGRVFSGGEALPRRLARTFIRELPWSSLVNLYGPTECTINATAYLIDPAALDDRAGTVPIGVPVDNTQCFILDEDLAPAAIGQTGELYIGGVQLARGYLNRPDQTRERFIPSPFVPTERLYRTGDLAYWNPDGTIQFTGRADNQIKLRGNRVELDEIALAIEEHTWVRRAAVIVVNDARTGSQTLVACVELNPKEAALMDQGKHGGHHRSKASKLQVKAQLSDPGLRDPQALHGRPVVHLPGREATPAQRRDAFARKTYRFYEGAKVARSDVRELLAPRPVSHFSRELGEVTFVELGEVLRWFGQHRSDERLLPKYAYASPGALYATQLYLETSGLAGVAAGVYYFHPVDHTLIRVGESPVRSGESPVRSDPYLSAHFVGKKRAIEPVYKHNLQEVLELEAGHMVGVLEEVLPGYGLNIRSLAYDPAVRSRLDVADQDYYLGTFEVHANDGVPRADPVEIFVQAHPGKVDGMPAGQYRYAGGELERISEELVLAKHVIAINQKVHERASFAITAVSRADQPWLEYVSLGTKLHHLQRNGLGLGFMSSGYSSKSGHPTPAARRMDDILASCGIGSGASYFYLGGGVSDEQVRSEGMYEDAVHMMGPAEMIKDELAGLLPEYMIPNRVVNLEALPLTANGKVDALALATCEEVTSVNTASPYVAPATRAERWLAEAWGKALRYQNVSIEDDFFASGGDSMSAVALIHRINTSFGIQLPFQVVFECPKLIDLAARVESDTSAPSSRLLLLHNGGTADPVFCWPGLGGYPMNLRLLARAAGVGRPFYGLQAHGINAGEVPYPTIREMAAADVAELRRTQPTGPYTLWGYSFGARVAFEAAWQLERAGEQVENLLLICPGSPRLRQDDGDRHGRDSSYRNPGYLTILFSVFAGAISGPELEQCLATVRDEDSFVSFVQGLFPALDEQLVRRITRIVGQTHEFEYTFGELTERRLNAPVTVFKASGDDYSFIEGRSGYSAAPPTVVDLDGDHYSVLQADGVAELVSAIRARLGV